MREKHAYTATHRLMLIHRGKPTREGTILTRDDGKMIVVVNALPTAVLHASPIRKRVQVNVTLADFGDDQG